MKTILRTRLACFAIGLAASFPAAAGIIHLDATINGAQANAGAGSGSTATGSASMTYDDVTSDFSWNISWSGLSGPVTVAHFHGAALPNANAGVQVNFAAISGSTSPSIGNTTITALQATDLLAGLWYINIHTQVHPGGEIRGQVRRSSVPEPSTLGLLGLASLGLLLAGRRRRSL